jgi:hypothetical protein
MTKQRIKKFLKNGMQDNKFGYIYMTKNMITGHADSPVIMQIYNRTTPSLWVACRVFQEAA